MLTLRYATHDDAAAMAGVFYAGVLECGPRCFSAGQVAAWAAAGTVERMADWLSSYAHFVAVRGGEVVGFAGVSAEGYISSVYLHGDHVRQRVGSQLLKRVMAHAQSRGVVRFYAEANAMSLGLFLKHGFVVTGTDVKVLGGERFERTLVAWTCAQKKKPTT